MQGSPLGLQLSTVPTAPLLPVVPSLELPHLPLGFFPIPAVMFLQSRYENFGAHLELLDLIVAQTPPPMFDAVFQPLKVRLSPAH